MISWALEIIEEQWKQTFPITQEAEITLDSNWQLHAKIKMTKELMAINHKCCFLRETLSSRSLVWHRLDFFSYVSFWDMVIPDNKYLHNINLSINNLEYSCNDMSQRVLICQSRDLSQSPSFSHLWPWKVVLIWPLKCSLLLLYIHKAILKQWERRALPWVKEHNICPIFFLCHISFKRWS